jgi:hypothetical protein
MQIGLSITHIKGEYLSFSVKRGKWWSLLGFISLDTVVLF